MKNLLLMIIGLSFISCDAQEGNSNKIPRNDLDALEKINTWYESQAPHFRPAPSYGPTPEAKSFSNLEDLKAFPTEEAEKVITMYLSAGTDTSRDILKEIIPLGKFKNLQYLAIGSSSYVPYDFEGLDNLKTLVFENSRSLLEFPSSMGKAKNLEALIIDRANKATSLPESMYDLENLRTLKITGFSPAGDSLSAKIRNFQKLEYLEITYCMINVPEEIGELHKLKELRLRNYFNLTIPTEEIYRLPQLEVLGLYIYKDEHHEGMGQLKSLKLLHLNADFVGKEVAELEQLEGLMLVHNKNEIYPDELAQLKNLEVLVIDNNRLISEAPKFIPRLEKLKHLTFNGCQNLRTFDQSFATMKDLEEMKLSYNNSILEIPESLKPLGDKVKLKRRN